MRIGVSPKLELWVYASNQVVKCLDLSVDWQVIDLENTPEPAADGHSPLVAWLRNPVGGNDGARSEIPTTREVVVDKILRAHPDHALTIGIAGERPKLLTSKPTTHGSYW
jgi:hypothetical protein